MEVIVIVIAGIVIVAAIALLIFSIVHSLPCMIIKILINIFRIYLAILYCDIFDGNGEEVFYFFIKMAVITGVLTLYGGGASVYQNTLHETGNLLLNPTDSGFALVKETAGDSPMGNFIGAVLYSGIIAIVFFFGYTWVMFSLARDFGSRWPTIIVFCSLSVIGIIRSVITFIAYRNKY